MFQNTDVFAQERELLKVAGNFFDKWVEAEVGPGSKVEWADYTQII